MSEPLLRISRLEVGYGAARVLNSVDLSVEPQQIVGLIGRNGAGKTTMLRVVSGLVRRRGGDIRVNGEPLPSRPDVVARKGVVQVPEGRGPLSSGAVRGRSAEPPLRAGALAHIQPDAPLANPVSGMCEPVSL